MDGSVISLVYILNIHLLFFYGIIGIFRRRRLTAVVYTDKMVIKESNRIVETYDLSKVMKFSIHYNHATLYFKGFSKHLIFANFTSRSQRLLRSLGKA